MTHQIEIVARHGKLAVTCPCLRTRVTSPDWRPYRIGGVSTQRRQSSWKRGVIEARAMFPAAEAVAAWRDWHQRAGIEL